MWRFLADPAGEELVVGFSDDGDFETIAGNCLVGGDADDDIPLDEHLCGACGRVAVRVPGPDVADVSRDAGRVGLPAMWFHVETGQEGRLPSQELDVDGDVHVRARPGT